MTRIAGGVRPHAKSHLSLAKTEFDSTSQRQNFAAFSCSRQGFGKNKMNSELRPQFVVTTCEMKTGTMKNLKARIFNDHLSCRRILLLVAFVLAWAWLSPVTQA